MFDQLNDLPHDLVRERLLDARRERLALQAAAQRNSERLGALRLRLGDVLITWGLHLKRQTSNMGLARQESGCQELAGQEFVGHRMARG